MKIGPVHVTVLTSNRELIIRDEIRRQLTSIPVQDAIGRIIRGEVKNYLASICEKAEVPFYGETEFMKAARNAGH